MRDDARKSGAFKYRGNPALRRAARMVLTNHMRTCLCSNARQVAADDAHRAGAISSDVHQSAFALHRHARHSL